VSIDLGERATAAATKAAGEVLSFGQNGMSLGFALRLMRSTESGSRGNLGGPQKTGNKAHAAT
jgi:hypothetical protein